MNLDKAYNSNNDAVRDEKKYDFENPQSLAFTKPISLRFLDKTTIKESSWKLLYVKFLGVLYMNYPLTLKKLKSQTVSGATTRLVVDKKGSLRMRNPYEFAKGLYVETNSSASDIMSNLKKILDACNVDYEDVVVMYEEKGNISNGKKALATDLSLPHIRTNTDKELSQKYPLLFKRVYEALNSYSGIKVSASDVHDKVGSIARLSMVEYILNYASWSKVTDGGMYKFSEEIIARTLPDENNDNSSTYLQTLDFNNIGDLSFTKPFSLSYSGKEHAVTKWSSLYAKLAGMLATDYPQIIVSGLTLSRSSQIEVSSEPYCLRRPEEISEGLYIETNHSATTIASDIRKLLQLCGVNPSEIKITYHSSGRGSGKIPAVQNADNSSIRPHTLNIDNRNASLVERKLYDKLYSISRIYDDPTGISLSKIMGLLGSNIDSELVQKILDYANWSHKMADGIYSFATVGTSTSVNENPIADFDKDKYIEVLMSRYRNGITFDSIDFDNFREIYEDFNDCAINADDAMLEKQLRLCGVFYNDRLFPAEGIMDNDIKAKLFAYIENNFSSGKKVLYYKAIFEDLADDFASCFTLADENMLRAFIKFTAEDGKYYFFKDYMSIDASVEVDNTAEVEEFLLSAGKPMKVEDVCTALTHIPEDKVDSIIKFDNRFRRNARGEYFHVDIFEVSDEELEKIAAIIDGFIAENDYAIWTDVWNMIQETMPVFLENNLYLSAMGVRNAISSYYDGKFKFKGAVISRPTDGYEMRDVYQLYARHHATFTADDIYNLSKELDTTIYFDALSEVTVRVSYGLFISKDLISFDVDAVDRTIGSFLSKDYIRIREIDSYLDFQNVGYEWNEYLLESFLLSYSKKFELLNNGLSLKNVAGFVVKRNGQIKEFADACAYFLADGHTELKKKDALNYLASTNVISHRSYKDIDLALDRATQIRARKG